MQTATESAQNSIRSLCMRTPDPCLLFESPRPLSPPQGPWTSYQPTQKLILSILCDCMRCSPLVSSVHGIFQARMTSGLSFPNQGISLTQQQTYISCASCIQQADSLSLSHLGRPASLLPCHILYARQYFITCHTTTFVPDIEVIIFGTFYNLLPLHSQTALQEMENR